MKKFELIRSLNGKWQLAPKRASSTAFILCQMEKMCQIAGSKVTFSNLNLKNDQIDYRKLVGNQKVLFMMVLIILELKVKQSEVSNVPIGTMSHFMSTPFLKTKTIIFAGTLTINQEDLGAMFSIFK